ncbi:hypothetical protein pb186bvf_001602 [Paramecium bursaria]
MSHRTTFKIPFIIESILETLLAVLFFIVWTNVPLYSQGNCQQMMQHNDIECSDGSQNIYTSCLTTDKSMCNDTSSIIDHISYPPLIQIGFYIWIVCITYGKGLWCCKETTYPQLMKYSCGLFSLAVVGCSTFSFIASSRVQELQSKYNSIDVTSHLNLFCIGLGVLEALQIIPVLIMTNTVCKILEYS